MVEFYFQGLFIPEALVLHLEPLNGFPGNLRTPVLLHTGQLKPVTGLASKHPKTKTPRPGIPPVRWSSMLSQQTTKRAFLLLFQQLRSHGLSKPQLEKTIDNPSLRFITSCENAGWAYWANEFGSQHICRCALPSKNCCRIRTKSLFSD